MLVFDPYFKARIASASTLAPCWMILLQLHRGILYLLQHEANARLLALLFKILRLVISSTPYSRMPPDLLPTVITSLRRRIEEGLRFKNDQTGLLVRLTCMHISIISYSQWHRLCM
ncbi:hypothetical protein K1719_042588 [Acacia pycnantha]|nr:hypothetical protein K1719_042588 [Acacia pycnantha]